jgi:hypothetical protein
MVERIDPKLRDLIIGIGRAIDDVINPGWDKGRSKELGFALIVFPLRADLTDVNFLSNSDHERLERAVRSVLENIHPAEEKSDGPCQDD